MDDGRDDMERARDKKGQALVDLGDCDSMLFRYGEG